MTWPADANWKHGMSKSPEYCSWKSMRSRCNNPKNKNYKEYGGRGISVCPEWDNANDGFETFYRDVGPRSENGTLERKDNDGPYCKDNCIWTSRTMQARNRRNSRIVILDGKEITLSEACELTGVNYFTAHKRLVYMGWPINAIFEGVLW